MQDVKMMGMVGRLRRMGEMGLWMIGTGTKQPRLCLNNLPEPVHHVRKLRRLTFSLQQHRTDLFSDGPTAVATAYIFPFRHGHSKPDITPKPTPS